ncbi:hypothetical protein CTI12_AA448170 [Artemisia annua]|uniref:Replication protein A 70 kDa DNA-binding subunit B/D first OB fold domain-containing protein n=1 Tax=Artemisia annua TaxID=35608 RepID=A0A2U1LTE8_ARTAN|nr:hypothetical protein CTI12_AA448170 [Artemisia annua]
MTGKRKAFPNNSVEDMSIQVSESLDFHTSHGDGLSVSSSISHLGVGHVGGHGVVSSHVFHTSVATPSSFCPSIPGSSSGNTLGIGTSQTTGGCLLPNRGHHSHLDQNRLLHCGLPPHLDSPVGVPVQVPTVDGSVSVFEGNNTMHPSYVVVRSSGIHQVVECPSIYSHHSAGHAPMVLDFSSGNVTYAENVNVSSSTIHGSAPQSRVPAMPTRRVGYMYIPIGGPLKISAVIYRYTTSAPASVDPPVQGPAAPAQRQGAPLDYKCFGRCNQVCQRCGAVFWLEERRTGLPISVAPQYQRCCAAGRVALRSHERYPPYITHIRLFGVVGANQYELPTADGIGAIVYEGGPETITDYDVVIERHSGEPESVNKLHPAYMSLQFPLLFIYGEEGYHLKLRLRNPAGDDHQQEKKMEMALTVDPATSEKNAEAPVIPSRQLAYLTELSPADNSKFIEVRVYRKWTAVKIPGFTPISFSCILLDKKGSAIQANADLKEKARFEHELQINSVYKIQGFGFEKADGWGKTLDNDFTLSFGKYTQIQQLSDTDFPYHYFNFAAFNELNARLEKKNPILTGDYIGYVHNVDKVNEYGGATTTRVKVRNIGIRNLNNDVVPFTLWNDDAENFKEAEYAQMKQPVILAVSSCYLKRYAGQIQLSATSATRYYFNPDVEETGKLLAAYNQANASRGHIQVQTQRLTSWEQERNRNRVPLGTLLQIDPKTQQKCDECGGKLTYGYLHGQCHQYGTKTNHQNSYCFRIVITDGTGNAVVSCFTPQTDGLIKDVNTLLQEVENKDPATIPPAILALQNTRHIFQFQFAAPTAKGPTTFVLKKIMDEPQATLPTSSASPSSPPVVPMTVNAGEEYTPPPATPTVTQDTPADVPTITIPPHDPSAKKNYSQHPPVKNVVQPQRNTRKNRVSTILYVYHKH